MIHTRTATQSAPQRHRARTRLFAAGASVLALSAYLSGCGSGTSPVLTTPTPTPTVKSWKTEFTAGGENFAYGITLRNGRSEPWTTGPAPLTNLADNPELLGNISWSGWLLGYTPAGEHVTGDADLTLALETLDGTAEFSELKASDASQTTNPAGSGTTWRDGDLSYTIAVRGNTFTRTGGDDGTVSGSFLGTTHQAMSGTLQHDDLSAAFGGRRDPLTTTTPTQDNNLPPLPALPLQGPEDSGNSPILYVDRNLHVGADVAPASDALEHAASHDGIALSHGSVADGVGAENVTSLLSQDATLFIWRDYPDQYFIDRFHAPPTVHVAENTSTAMVDLTVRALQLINAALPPDWQLRLDPTPAPATHIGRQTLPHDEIWIEFLPNEQWPQALRDRRENASGIAGIATSAPNSRNPDRPPAPRILSTGILIDPTRDSIVSPTIDTLVHEILHGLGRHHPLSSDFSHLSVMGVSPPHPHTLYPLDREALLAVYDRLEPGTTVASLAEDLGPWHDTSTHLLGNFSAGDEDVAFGVALRNGLGQPWVTGPAPLTNLENNSRLSGSASWSGRLVGLTPTAEPVAGAADLTVGLATLDGSAEFSELETWSAGAAPGAIGSGATWTDGNLAYSIEVRGNTFTDTGGDDGILTGAFFGDQHEGMGGTLQRDDLSAAFGGSR